MAISKGGMGNNLLFSMDFREKIPYGKGWKTLAEMPRYPSSWRDLNLGNVI